MTEPHARPIDLIHAAGAVVWRGDPRSPEVAVIHRPRYDDWTFPKGKLKPGEHVIAGCLREVEEETGLRVLLGRALPPVHYLHRGRLKRVDYWAARVAREHPFSHHRSSHAVLLAAHAGVGPQISPLSKSPLRPLVIPGVLRNGRSCVDLCADRAW